MNPDTTYFTSDTHFYHSNIIKFEDRRKFTPQHDFVKFNNIEEMNKDIIKCWNETVSDDDDIFHLGDFSWGNNNKWREIRYRLNGKIHLIRGNHDYKKSESFLFSLFETVSDYNEIDLDFNDEKIKVVLSHYPFYTWNRMNYGSWNLFGHVHSKFKSVPGRMLSMNVGWDIWNKPVSANELACYFYKLSLGHEIIE